MSTFSLSAATKAVEDGDRDAFVVEVSRLRDRLRELFQGKLMELVSNFLRDLWGEFSEDPTKLYDLFRRFLAGWDIELPEWTTPPTTSVAALDASWSAAAIADEVVGNVPEGEISASAIDPTWLIGLIRVFIELLLKRRQPVQP